MKPDKDLLIFILFTFTLTSILTLSHNMLFNGLAQAVPGFALLLITLFSEQKKALWKESGLLKLGSIKWYAAALTLPIAVIIISYSGAASLQFLTLSHHFNALGIATLVGKILLFTFMWPFLWAFAEELGWRGFLQPKLIELLGTTRGIFTTGLMWAFWHFSFILFANYYENGIVAVNLGLFTMMVLLMSFAIGWIRLKSQSIWPCVIFHSASNAAWIVWGYQYKVVNPNYIYVTGEAGIINILLWGLVAFVVVRKMAADDRTQEALSY